MKRTFTASLLFLLAVSLLLMPLLTEASSNVPERTPHVLPRPTEYAAPAPPLSNTPIRLGVLAIRPPEQALAQWQPLATYLETRLGQRVELSVFGFPELEAAVAGKTLDVVLTNPGYHILLRQRHGLSAPLATQINLENGREVATFGGVIITRADNMGINSLADLAGKRISATSKESFGGYQMQAIELLEAGVPLPNMDMLLATGMPHDRVVKAVLSGIADAGFVRSGVIEALVSEDKLDLDRIKIIHRQYPRDYPYVGSTRLYPEWPVAMVLPFDEQLARRLAVALFSLPSTSSAARTAGIHGFAIPADYSDVDNLLRRLRLPPYEAAPEFTLADLWQRYAVWIAVTLCAMLLVFAGMGMRLQLQNRRLRHNEIGLKLAASVFSHAREGIMITDANGVIVEVNGTFSHLTGYTREEVLGKNPSIFNSGLQGPEFYVKLWQELHAKGHWYGELWNRRKDGTVYAEMITISAVHDAAGRTQNYVSLFTDITAAKEHQQQLEHIAHYDALTNLPNRVLLADRLRQGMAQCQRNGLFLAVAHLDLDGFKAINDHHGHDVGDLLLIAIAQRMKVALRDGDTLSRIGGDEFVAVLINLEQLMDCWAVLERLLQAAATQTVVNDTKLHVSASIGVTLYPKDGVDAEQLLRHADQAMYQAKQGGKNRYHLFDVEKDAAVQTQRESLEHIRLALDRREFVLHYQPKVNMKTGEVVGAEALIRWQHSERGLLAPTFFLPTIENHPISVELGEWVIDTALTQMSEWHAVGLDIPVSVNVGARQLQQADFPQRIEALLLAHPDVLSSFLELEIVETSALEDVAQVSAIMHACRDLGVRFALDDFGTGYSSLTYLKRLPAGMLKIDHSFVRDMLDDPDDLAIVEGVIGLAMAFGRQVIAEGVETVAHGELLLPLGCELAQGYGIARPMPAEELPGWAATWCPDAAWSIWGARTRGDKDLPVAYAEVKHRHWMRALEAFLAGNRDHPPQMDVNRCSLGLWQNAEGRMRFGKHADFPKVIELHEQIHTLGNEMVHLSLQGHRIEVQAKLEELYALGNHLIIGLRLLARG
jgi:diguanylate cyclase (GGDEF)-like protein/PAS domain S-box-containing protein